MNAVRTKSNLRSFEVTGAPGLYLIGSFEEGVTVLSQQTRALNLVWNLIESMRVGANPIEGSEQTARPQIAIIGGGVSGLTAAAALIKKHVISDITVFEQRDTLLPIQNGNETRWLHPNIYDWPAVGSYSNSAMLPLMNWTAARASDVVVQLIKEWKATLAEANNAWSSLSLFCNTKHLHVSQREDEKFTVEWVGDERCPADGSRKTPGSHGGQKEFDIVIMAVGFGIEDGSVLSYWRNDNLSQPNLLASRQRFIVSGQGDGAIIDVLRLRLANFRQDRIIGEIFRPHVKLIGKIRDAHAESLADPTKNIFDLLSKIESSDPDGFAKVLKDMASRLRRDTEVVLQVKQRRFSDLFNSSVTKISFQNRVLLYFLYKCGGFTPEVEDDSVILGKHNIDGEHFIRRRGVNRLLAFARFLSSDLLARVEDFKKDAKSTARPQIATPSWPGGYFGYPGTLANIVQSSKTSTPPADLVARGWRQEHLPGATTLAALGLCSCISGYLATLHQQDKRLRVTLHRALAFGGEELLQQCAEYCGLNVQETGRRNAGRTFPSSNGTIGLAYLMRSLIRTKPHSRQEDILAAMKATNLNDASRSMVPGVQFLLAIPILEGAGNGEHTGISSVWGVIYIDSTDPNFFLDDDAVKVLISMISAFSNDLVNALMRGIPDLGNSRFKRSEQREESRKLVELPTGLEALDVLPPSICSSFDLNIDYADFLFESEG